MALKTALNALARISLPDCALHLRRRRVSLVNEVHAKGHGTME